MWVVSLESEGVVGGGGAGQRDVGGVERVKGRIPAINEWWSRCHEERSTLHWALSCRPGDRGSKLLEVIEGHSVLLRPEAAGHLGRRPEAERVAPQLSGLSPVTSEAKHGQPRHREMKI